VGNPQILGETAGVVVGAVEGFAGGMTALEAVPAGVAGYMVGDEDPVALAVGSDPGADRDDGPGYFVSQHQGGLPDPVPLHDVAAADPAGHYLDQHLTGADGRNGQLLDPDIIVAIIHGDAHGSFPIACPSPFSRFLSFPL